MLDRPNPIQMQYLSLNPISLALAHTHARVTSTPRPLDSVDAEEERERVRKAKLVEKLRLHTVVTHPPSQKQLSLSSILAQVNCSFEIGRLLERNVGLIGSRQRRSMSVGERVVESAATLRDYIGQALWHVFAMWLYPIFTSIFKFGLICHRIAAEVVLQVVEWRPRSESAALKDVSATAQQVDIRLQQFCYWPLQYITLRKRKDDWESVTTSHPEYIRFYNSLWLVANDVIIGIALGSYIIDNVEWVAFQIDHVLSGWTVEGLQRMIIWLMDWPAGLKLNNELAAFLGDLFLWVIDYWASSSPIDGLSAFASADWSRLHCKLATLPTSNHLLPRNLEFCWSKHAHITVLGPVVRPHSSHILLLHCIGPYLQLAADNNNVSVSLVSRKEEERASKSHRLVRLRSRPAATRHHSLHAVILLATNRTGVLLDLCIGTHGDHFA